MAVETNLATIDSSKYPIIRINFKSCNPTDVDSDIFIQELNLVIKSKKGPYVCLIDLTNAVWISTKSARDILATGTQYLEDEYKARYKKIFFHIPNILLWLSFKLTYLIIKPRVVPESFFDLEKTENAVKKYLKTMS